MAEPVRISWERACGLRPEAGQGVLLGVVPDPEHRAVLVVARSDGNVVTVPYHGATHDVKYTSRKREYNHERET